MIEKIKTLISLNFIKYFLLIHELNLIDSLNFIKYLVFLDIPKLFKRIN